MYVTILSIAVHAISGGTDLTTPTIFGIHSVMLAGLVIIFILKRWQQFRRKVYASIENE
jgi:hypothetical protein